MKVTIIHKPYGSSRLRMKEGVEITPGEVFSHRTLGRILFDAEGFLHANPPLGRHAVFELQTRAYVGSRAVRCSVPLPSTGLKANVASEFGYFTVLAKKTSRMIAWITVHIDQP